MAIANKNVEKVIFTSDIAVVSMNINRLMQLDLNGYNFMGNINFENDEVGTVKFDSSVTGGKVDGNLTVNTGNADFIVGENVEVTGKTTIIDVKANTFISSGRLKYVVITDSNGTSFDNKGIVSDVVEIAAKGKVTLKGQISSVKITETAEVIVQGSIGEFTVIVPDVILDDANKGVKIIKIEEGASLKDPEHNDIPATSNTALSGEVVKTTKGQQATQSAKTIVSYKFDEGYAPKMSNFIFNINDGDGVMTTNNYFGATQKVVNGIVERRTGVEVAEAIVYDLNIGRKVRFGKLTSKWEITNVGSEVIFTSKLNKSYDDFQIVVPTYNNRAEIKGTFLIKQTGSEGIGGKAQVNTLTIKGTAGEARELSVTFTDGLVTVDKTIKISEGDTLGHIAEKITIAFSDLAEWEVTNTQGSADVLFTAREAAEDRDVRILIK